jgi:hypothetical protein
MAFTVHLAENFHCLFAKPELKMITYNLNKNEQNITDMILNRLRCYIV